MKKILIGVFIVTLGLVILWKKDPQQPLPEPVRAQAISTRDEKQIRESKISSETKDLQPFAKDERYPEKISKAYVEEKIGNLPTLADVAHLSIEETHHTPEILQKGVLLLGQVAQDYQRDSNLRPSVVEFYRRCSESSEILDSLRAVCYSDLLALLPQSKYEVNVPSEIAELAQDLPPPVNRTSL